MLPVVSSSISSLTARQARLGKKCQGLNVNVTASYAAAGGALDTQDMQAVQSGFNQADHDKELARLIDRLGARFGARRVLRFESEDTHIPEHAASAVPVAQSARKDQGGWHSGWREKLD